MKEMNKQNIIEKIRNYLYQKSEIDFAYIFGSFVQNDRYHDIDIAVFLSHRFNKNDMKKFPYGYESYLISELNCIVRKNIDFIVMNNAEIMIQQRIINNGILLFSKNERKQLFYENYIRKLYIDAEPLRKIKRYYLTRHIINA